MLRAGVVIAVMALTPSIASADEVAPPPPPMQATTVQPEEWKSPLVAMLLSVGATGVPIAAAAAVFRDDDGNGQYPDALWAIGGVAVLIGPSVGHWYAGKYFTLGLVARATGFALGAFAVNGRGHEDDKLGALLVGGACLVGGAIYDLATADRSAREYNFEHAKKLLPTVAPVASGTGVQIGLAGTF